MDTGGGSNKGGGCVASSPPVSCHGGASALPCWPRRGRRPAGYTPRTGCGTPQVMTSVVFFFFLCLFPGPRRGTTREVGGGEGGCPPRPFACLAAPPSWLPLRLIPCFYAVCGSPQSPCSRRRRRGGGKGGLGRRWVRCLCFVLVCVCVCPGGRRAFFVLAAWFLGCGGGGFITRGCSPSLLSPESTRLVTWMGGR